MRDTILANARILTQSHPPAAPAPIATTLVIRDGRIAAVGDDSVSAAASPGAERIDLGGRTVIPGFNDAHAHIWKIGHLLTTMLDLRGVESVEALCGRVREFAARLPEGAWLLGRGYNEAAMTERRPPTRHELDLAASGRPVVLTRTCGHIYVVSSRALQAAGIGAGTADPIGGVIDRDPSGEPSGLLQETAMGLMTRVIPPPTTADYQRMIVAGLEHQLSLGITSSSDCGVSPQLLEVYRQMETAGQLPARVNVMPLRRVDGVAAPVPLPERFESDFLRVNTVKFLADGGLSGATAALSVNYRHAEQKGVLRFEREELHGLCLESHAAGWRIATHAIGDVAIEQMLDIYESLGPHPHGWAHRIEHFGLPDAGQLRRAAALGVIAAPQTIFIHSLGLNFRNYLPDSFLPRTYPIRAMLDAGVRVALSSDAPVVEDDNPLVGMMAAITRLDREGWAIAPEQSITAAEALYAYTAGGAVATGQETALGSIEAGEVGRPRGAVSRSTHQRAGRAAGHHRGDDHAGGAEGVRTVMNSYQQYIGGAWTEASNGGTWQVLNPATEEVIRAVPYGNAVDCDRAIEAAREALPAWSARTPYERGALLKRAAELMRASADELGRTTVLESGKPFVQGRGEWMVSADLFEWFAEEGKRAYGRMVPARASTRRLMVLKQPIGVVGLITAWNFPAYNIARAGAAALAAGCTIVVRPSEYTPLTAMDMVRVLAEAGIPPGVVNLVNGEPEAMGQAMLRHPACAKIHFTGSVRVGKLLMDGASQTVTRLSLELGGNAPVIVFPDVDLAQLAARRDRRQVSQRRPGLRGAATIPGRPDRGRRVRRSGRHGGGGAAGRGRDRTGHPGRAADQRAAARPGRAAGAGRPRCRRACPGRRTATRRSCQGLLLPADGGG